MSSGTFLLALAVMALGTYGVRTLGVQLSRRRAGRGAAGAATASSATDATADDATAHAGDAGTDPPHAAPSRASAWFDRATVVLILGLVVSSTFFDGQAFGPPSRMIAVAVGVGAAVCRAPMLLCVLLAMGVAAGLRLLGMG